MANSNIIKKTKPDPSGLDFDALRKEGISLLQNLAGSTWTDFNTHDPGVTILEQLCYGMTDLAFRTEFDVEDYLTGPSGRLDYERQALYRPQDIFPSQAITKNDYRKVIFDAIPQIDDIWIKPFLIDGEKQKGLCSVYAKLNDSSVYATPELAVERISQLVRMVFSGCRNLCEDIQEIHIVKTVPYFLKGDIDIDGMRPAPEILAEIIFSCAQHISSGLKMERFDDVFAQDENLEKIFTGPMTKHGFIDTDNLDKARDQVTVVELIRLIRSIPGVKQVRNLTLVDANGDMVESLLCDPVDGNFPFLQFPESEEHGHFLKLMTTAGDARKAPSSAGMMQDRRQLNEEKNRIFIAEAKLEFKKLQFERQAFRTDKKNIEGFIKLPSGQYREVHDYYSVQNNFPGIYGINHYGVPASASNERKAQAKQLKAYLFPFEQLMANYLQNLQELPNTFSVDKTVRRSYFSQHLDNKNIPNISELYRDRPAVSAASISNTLAKYDNFGERRGRVLDYLLGIYGEEFSQNSLRRFNQYYGRYTDHWLIDTKINLLKNLPDLSKNRAAAFDYMKPSWDSKNISRLQKKIAILLGLKNFERFQNLSTALTDNKLNIVTDAEFKKTAVMPAANKPRRYVPRLTSAGAAVVGEHDGQVPEIKLSDVPTSLLHKGISLENYRLVDDGGKTLVCFKPGEKNDVWQLDSCDDNDVAVRRTHGLVQSMLDLNQASEGLHIVEHLLLRPRRNDSKKKATAKVPDGYFDFRISVIFPAWTARFNDTEFRKYAEEALVQNCPAHVYPQFYWLDLPKMWDFETRYATWLKEFRDYNLQAKGNYAVARAGLDAAADNLLAFLLKNQGQSGHDRWV